MSLTKEIVVDSIEVTENGFVQVRTATRIIENGEVLSKSYHRHALAPGDDLTGQDPRVIAIATAAWAPQ